MGKPNLIIGVSSMEELVNSHVFTDFVTHLIRWLCTPNCISQLIFIVLVRVELVFLLFAMW